MYSFFLGDIHFPVTPDNIEIFEGGRGRLIDLSGDGVLDMLRGGGVKAIRFKAKLPVADGLVGGAASGYDIARRADILRRSGDVVRFVVLAHTELKYRGHISMDVRVTESTAEPCTETGYCAVLSIGLAEKREYFARAYDAKTAVHT